MTNQFEQYIQEGMRRAMRESMQKMHDDMRRPPVSGWNARHDCRSGTPRQRM